MHALVVVLRVVHILFAIFWVGALLLATFFLFPSVESAGAAGDAVLARLDKRGMFAALGISGILTILSGGTLLWLDAGGNFAAYSATPVGRTFSSAGGLAIVAFLIGFVVVRPMGDRLIRASAELQTVSAGAGRQALETEIAVLRRRLTMITIFLSVLVVLAASGMAVARYM